MDKTPFGAALPASRKPLMGGLMRYVVGQFGNPHGIAGMLAGRFMAMRTSNTRRNLRTVELMALVPGMAVMEIGFGPGVALGEVLKRVDDGKGGGRVMGFDRSRTMTDMAARRNARAIAEGRLELFTGSIEDTAFDSIDELRGPFDRIFAVNVVMFWREPVAVLARLRERLAEGGEIALTLQPRGGDRSRAGVEAIGERIAGQVREAGLRNVRIAWIEEVAPMAACILGEK